MTPAPDGSKQEVDALSHARLQAFFRTACATAYPPRAVHLVCEMLDRDVPFDLIFPAGRAAESGLMLSVRQMEDGRYEITFGSRGRYPGDGGVWLAEFEGDHIVSLEQPGFWLEGSQAVEVIDRGEKKSDRT